MSGPKGLGGKAGGAEKLDFGRLEGLVRGFIEASIAPSTARVYASGQRRYLTFCRNSNSPPLPLTESHLCLFVAYLADEGLKHTSIKGYLSAIRRLQIVQGLGDPFVASWPLLECTLKGIKLRQAKSVATRSKSRLPITPNILKHLRKFWEKDRHNADNIMLWAACCTCFFGFLRSGEITVPSMRSYDPGCHLSAGDVSVDSLASPKVVQIHIKASKTDPFRKGVMVYLGRTDNVLCPVGAVSAYLAVRGQSPGPFFRLASGVPLSREVMVKRMREALQPSGVDITQYSGHSVRIGAATTAATVGIEDSLIKTLGRWESTAYLSYVRVPRDRLAGVSKQLANSGDQ